MNFPSYIVVIVLSHLYVLCLGLYSVFKRKRTLCISVLLPCCKFIQEYINCSFLSGSTVAAQRKD